MKSKKILYYIAGAAFLAVTVALYILAVENIPYISAAVAAAGSRFGILAPLLVSEYGIWLGVRCFLFEENKEDQKLKSARNDIVCSGIILAGLLLYFLPIRFGNILPIVSRYFGIHISYATTIVTGIRHIIRAKRERAEREEREDASYLRIVLDAVFTTLFSVASWIGFIIVCIDYLLFWVTFVVMLLFSLGR